MDTNPAMRMAFSAALLASVASCSKGQNYSFAIMPTVETFQPKQFVHVSSTVAPHVRILFVEDNSGSMSQYQALLSSGFQSFATSYLNQAGLDLSVALITTDT